MKPMKLNQVIAIEKDVKNHAHKINSDVYKMFQKPDLFNGLYKTYQKKDEESEDLPTDRKHVQFKAHDLLESSKKAYVDLLNVTFQKDEANTKAKANLVVDGALICADVPVTTLLALEKMLVDHRALISALPVLDISEEWEEDKNETHFWRAASVATHRTKKVQKGLTLYHATEHHPAQTAIITDDVIVGWWQTEKVSGAIPRKVKERMIARVDILIRYTKQTREEANDTTADTKPKLGEAVYLFLQG